ncbi:MAG: glycosyltransferase [Thermoanaerobaculia bacterium]
MRILIVAPRWPWPVRKGDQARSTQLAELLAEGHAVRLLAPEGTGVPPADPDYEIRSVSSTPWSRVGAAGRMLFGGGPLQHGLFDNAALRREFAASVRGFDRVILVTSRLAGLAGGVPEETLVVDLIDSLALNITRRAAVDRPWLRPFWQFEARRLRNAERDLVLRGRSALLVAERDRDYVARDLAADAAQRLRLVPLLLREPEVARPDDLGTGNEVLLTGNLGYFPTAQGADWFLRRVWPDVRGRRPEARLVFAGSRAPAALARRLREAGGELREQPPSLAREIAGAALAVVPLFAGSGTPMKLLEAVALGTPVLATPGAADGVAPEIRRLLPVAEEPADWSARIAGTLEDPQSAKRRAIPARDAALALHSRARVRAALERALD